MDSLGEMMAGGAREGCSGEQETGNAGRKEGPGPKLELQAGAMLGPSNKTTTKPTL